jgi:hypothetical protein
VFLIFGGGQPFKPWLDIPSETYYRYNVFFSFWCCSLIEQTYNNICDF